MVTMSPETSNYIKIDHPIDRSLLGTCAITILFLLVSLTLFGPFIVVLVPTLIVASICRFVIKLFFCEPCQSSVAVRSHEYYSPDSHLVAEETRWLKTRSKIVILMIIESGIDVEKLRSIVCSRLVKVKKDEMSLNHDSAPSLAGQPGTVPNDGPLLYPKFSQRICKSKAGWKWKFDRNFSIDNHIHLWKDHVPISILSCPDMLSELISNINSVQLDPEHPPWDSYLVPVTDSVTTNNNNSQSNNNNETASDKSILIFRLHPSLSDGISLVHILCTTLSDEQCSIELKDRFHSSGKFLNSIRALFIGPVVFIQKWFLTRRDTNVFHPINESIFNMKLSNNNSSTKISFDTPCMNQMNQKIDQDRLSEGSLLKTSEPDKLFHFCTYSLSAVSRIKCVTRSTFTEVFLAAVSGALRTYQQSVSKISHPYDILCLLPTDLTKEHHVSSPGRNSSSVASRTSNQSNTTDSSLHITNNYAMVDFVLPTNTEGMIPRLWEVKQRMEELKNSADSIILCGFSRILKHLFPERVGHRVMENYYNKNSLSISSLQGPDCTLSIGGKQIYNIIYWFPSLCDVSMSMSCFSYGDLFTCSVTGDSCHLPRIGLILDAVVFQLDLLNKLLENRRIPGEHRSHRYTAAGVEEPKLTLNVCKFDSNEREIIKQSLSPSISSDHLYTRLSSIQNQLQNDKDLTDEEQDTLRSEFSSLMGILRRRKSCGIDTNGEMADFDEEIEEMSCSQTGNRRPSLPGLMVLSTRRRSLGTSLARPLGTGHRSRSNSKAALQSSNYLVSPSCSSSKRPSLRIPDDIEGGLGADHNSVKLENRFLKYDKSRTNTESGGDNPRTTSRNESSPITVSVQSTSQFRSERTVPRRCREDRV